MARTRKEYIRALVDSVNKTISEEPENIEATQMNGEPAITGKWMDIALLCHVVEQDLLKGEEL